MSDIRWLCIDLEMEKIGVQHPLHWRLTLGEKSFATLWNQNSISIALGFSAWRPNSWVAALTSDPRRKIVCHTVESKQHQYCTWFFSLMPYQLSCCTDLQVTTKSWRTLAGKFSMSSRMIVMAGGGELVEDTRRFFGDDLFGDLTFS